MKKLLSVVLFSLATMVVHARIDKVITMTTDTELRLEVRLTSSGKASRNIGVKLISHGDGTVVWQGSAGRVKMNAGESTIVKSVIKDLDVRLWTPAAPNLYELQVGDGESTVSQKVGFRRFEMRDGRFLLNGKPVFLRGNAINPPGRGIPADLETSRSFARDYIRFLKGMNINIIRIPADQTWMEVCDEEGMMVFAGRYGRPRGGTPNTPPQDIDAAVEYYREAELGPFTSHPSMVIYVLSNEQAHSGEAGRAWDEFLQAAYERLVEWDDTRLYIGNAGYGLGRSADIYDVHRYWGWYYNTFLTYLNLREKELWQNPSRNQPITFTECVGNYTGIDGRYNLCSRTKQPNSQLCWTGHTPQEEQGVAALEYQAFVLKNATEMFRRMRSQNPNLAGIMPFTIMFHNWDGVESFAQMGPKPAAYQYGVSYQPVLLSWELWAHNLYAGNGFSAVMHIVNDSDDFSDLEGASVEWALEDINRIPVAAGRVELPRIEYYGTLRTSLDITIPHDTPTGRYTLQGTVMREGRIVARNSTELFVAGSEWEQPFIPGRGIVLYDTSGTTARAFDRAGIGYTLIEKLSTLDPADVLVIGEGVWDETLTLSSSLLNAFTSAGGRVVCLRQDGGSFGTDWLPEKVRMLRHSNNCMEYLSPEFTYADGMSINMERPDHPVFRGIERENMFLWSDHTGWDESQQGFPRIYPVTQGFDLAGADMRNVILLANYSRGIAAAALCEMLDGKGSVILSGFDAASKSGIDPVADRLLLNIMNYAAGYDGSDLYTFVDRPIVWGDFSSEKGIVSLALNGLILNTVPVIPPDQQKDIPVVVDEMGYWYAGSYGGWNTKPGVQYMPHGRRPFAPFTYTRGGNVLSADNGGGKATGFFLARIPEGRRTMTTLVQNPAHEDITLGIMIDGTGSVHTIAAGGTVAVETPTGGATRLKVEFEGDRRCVLLKTEFK